MEDILGTVVDDSAKPKANCPRCEQSRARGARILHCTAMPSCSAPTREPDAKDEQAFLQTAESAKERLEKLPLAQILSSDQLPDGSLPNLKQLVVQPGTYTVMVSQFHGDEGPQAGTIRVFSPGDRRGHEGRVPGGAGTASDFLLHAQPDSRHGDIRASRSRLAVQ